MALCTHPQPLLESACLRDGVLLLETIQAWREMEPEASFCSMILKNHALLQEDRWIEMIASHPGLPFFYPTSGETSISPCSLSSAGFELGCNQFALFLEEDPVLVVALLDPFASPSVSESLGQSFPNRPFALVSITPHSFARLATLAEKGISHSSPSWCNESLEQWCRQLNFDSRTYLDTRALVESIWLHEPRFPVLSLADSKQTSPIPGEPDCLLLRKTSTHAWVASLRVTEEGLPDRLYQKFGRRIHLLAVGPSAFMRIANQLEAKPSPSDKAQEIPLSLVVREWGVIPSQKSIEVALLDKIIESAIRRGASDIHLEPKTEQVQVRYRIDGRLIIQAPLPKNLYPLLLRRLKILSGMRHDKVGVIQDGAAHLEIDGCRYDMRTSITILKGGEETLVIRIFSSHIPRLDELNLPEKERLTLQWCLEQESGMLVSTGPTGSGKTTTLYACLQALASPHTSIVTIEQPVEKYFAAAKQIDVREGNDPSTITFASALRSILRQDPDVIMVGEMRDSESATIAIQAALSGHMVLSTVHAYDAVGVIERLCGSFGIDRLTLACALKLSVAQRLLTRLCPLCRRTRPARAEELKFFPAPGVEYPVVSEPVGCATCRGTGSAGRTIIMEMLPIDDEVSLLIEQRVSPREIRRHNHKRGYTNLLHQATRLLFQGEISLEEARSFLGISPMEPRP